MTIQVRGAREHNLKGVDLDLPLGKFVVFTGPSGSGKTSFVLDTLHAEGQRRYLEALGLRPQGKQRVRRPQADVILGLPPTLALRQEDPAPSPRSTVGTRTELLPLLRVLFARCGTQLCPICSRPLRAWTHDQIVAQLLRRPEGEKVSFEAPVRTLDLRSSLKDVLHAGFSRVRVGQDVWRVEEVPANAEGRLRVVVDRLRLESGRMDRVYDAVRTTLRAGGGRLVAVFDQGEEEYADRLVCGGCDREWLPLEPSLLSSNAGGACESCEGKGCATCDGTRLCIQARAVEFSTLRFGDLQLRSLRQVSDWASSAEETEVTTLLLKELRPRLQMLLDLGLGNLRLGASMTEVSSGERQRIRLFRQVGASLSGVLFLLDEPAAGLSGAEVEGVISVIRHLCQQGNTVFAVEHHSAVVGAADQVIDFGPGAGELGGNVIFRGTPAELWRSDTSTGRWMSGRERLPVAKPWDGEILRWKNCNLPKGGIGALWGPSGCGKTRALHDLEVEFSGGSTFLKVSRLSAPEGGRSARSSVSTYLGFWDILRPLLAETPEAALPRTARAPAHPYRFPAGDGLG